MNIQLDKSIIFCISTLLFFKYSLLQIENSLFKVNYQLESKIKLYYYIQEGEIDIYSSKEEFLFNCFAASGGGAYAGKNSTVHVSDESRNNICHLNITTEFNKNNEVIVRGGPIVPGEYTFGADAEGDASAKSDNRYISLIPNAKTQKNIKLLGRKGGFRIHCKGGRGSDGCIVPQKAEDFRKILAHIAKSSGGTLTVKKSRDGMEWSCGNVIIDNLD